MSFLDNFSSTFQEITWKRVTNQTNKYWENIEDTHQNTVFKWIILEKSQGLENFIKSNNLIQYNSKDFILYSPIEIFPNKTDKITLNWNEYNVIFREKIYIDWNHDHNQSIIRLID